MKLPYLMEAEDLINRSRFSIILVQPEKQENIGLIARAMKNTGFGELRLVGLDRFAPEAYRTAIHAGDILDRARFFPGLAESTHDLHLVFASTARYRKTFSIITLAEAADTMFRYPLSARIGLLFGNERTGLTSGELSSANFIFFIPQASRQPSYNLASAVLLTLFSIFSRTAAKLISQEPLPLRRKEQEDCVQVILKKLEEKDFIHKTNKTHVTELVQDLFGRMALNERDRNFLLALFNKAID